MLKVRGTVVEKLKVEEGTTKAGKPWTKQDLLILQEGQYPELLCVTLFGDKKDLITRIDKDEVVDVQFTVVSREFNGRYFHNINGYSVDVVLVDTSAVKGNEPQSPKPEEDDLPF